MKIESRSARGNTYLMDDMVEADVEAGRLTRVLADWCPPFSGYHLYYPSRRQLSPAFVLLVNALRFEGASIRAAHSSATRRKTS